jgi:hypothetical protein
MNSLEPATCRAFFCSRPASLQAASSTASARDFFMNISATWRRAVGERGAW